jgi:hypothetical protein
LRLPESADLGSNARQQPDTRSNQSIKPGNTTGNDAKHPLERNQIAFDLARRFSNAAISSAAASASASETPAALNAA